MTIRITIISLNALLLAFLIYWCRKGSIVFLFISAFKIGVLRFPLLCFLFIIAGVLLAFIFPLRRIIRTCYIYAYMLYSSFVIMFSFMLFVIILAYSFLWFTLLYILLFFPIVLHVLCIFLGKCFCLIIVINCVAKSRPIYFISSYFRSLCETFYS